MSNSTTCPVQGCSNHPCDVKTNTGVGTNGRCRCEEQTLRRALRWYRKRVTELEAELAKKSVHDEQQVRRQ